jgi:membrane protein
LVPESTKISSAATVVSAGIHPPSTMIGTHRHRHGACMYKPLRVGWRVVRQTAAGFSDDELMTRAAALAFYSALSFAPMLVLLLWIAASLRPEWQAELVATASGLVGSRAAGAVRLVIDNADQRPGFGSWAGWFGLAVTLIGASLVFAQLQGAINRVWGLSARPGRAVFSWLRTRLYAMGLLLGLAFLLIVSFSVNALIALFLRGDTLGWQMLEALIALVVFAVVFAGIFKLLPDAVIAWRDAVAGAILTTLLFTAGKFVIGLYLERSSVGGAYGPAAGIVVLLVWVYFSAVIVLLGAELTEAVAAERGAPIQPDAHATWVHPRSAAE